MEPASSFWAAHGPVIGLALYLLVFALAAASARYFSTFLLGTLRGGSLDTLHWTERNRRRFQEMHVGLVLGWAIPVTGAYIVWESTAKTFPGIGAFVVGTYALLRIALHRVARRALRATEDPNYRRRWEWPGSYAATVLLFGRSLFLAIVGTLLATFNPQFALPIAAGVVLSITLLNLPSTGIAALRALGVLRAPDDRLLRLVRETAEKLGRSVPPCYEVRGLGLNAVAWPAWGIVGVTRAALDCLDDDDVRALLLHEFGHLAEARSIVRLRLAASYLPLVFLLEPLVFARLLPMSSAGFVVVLALFLVGSSAVRMGLARTEDDADKFAAAAGGAPAAYARALEKLYHFNGFPAVQNVGGLHADLYDRLVAVGVTPDYPRPPAPSRRQRLRAVLLPSLLFAVLVTTTKVVVVELVDTEASSTMLALNGWQSFRRGWVYGELARRESDADRAGELLETAIEASPGEPIYLLNRAMLAAQAGDCGRAGARLMQGFTALERQSQIKASTALWYRQLERYVAERCEDEGVARAD